MYYNDTTNKLATISLESEVLEKINYEDIIEDFISKNPKRVHINIVHSKVD
jgi:hypothetical protein